MWHRRVGVEILDGLDASDPQAAHARRDLRRVHRVMGTRATLVDGLRSLVAPGPDATPIRALELGAGDGSLMLEAARILAPEWPPVQLTLLDRQLLLDDATIADYASLGWTATAEVADALDWAGAWPGNLPREGTTPPWDLIVANLFLHHFDSAQLSRLLAAIAATTARIFACEPRRGRLALAGSHLIGAIGVNAVTRNDAVLSVQAGFRARELTDLWPAAERSWRLNEYPARPFLHCFSAELPGVS